MGTPLLAVAPDPLRALGWRGVALPETTLLGIRLTPVVVLDGGAHRARLRSGDGPQRDAETLAVWEWPETVAPPPALRLVGGLFRAGRGWRGALADAGRWRGFGAAAVLVELPEPVDDLCRLEHQIRGVGLVAGGCCEVAAEPGRRAPARRRTADRWVEEVLYAEALAAGVFPG